MRWGMFRIYEDSDPVYVLMLHGNADGMELAGRMGSQSASESSLCIQRTDG